MSKKIKKLANRFNYVLSKIDKKADPGRLPNDRIASLESINFKLSKALMTQLPDYLGLNKEDLIGTTAIVTFDDHYFVTVTVNFNKSVQAQMKDTAYRNKVTKSIPILINNYVRLVKEWSHLWDGFNSMFITIKVNVMNKEMFTTEKIYYHLG